MITKEIARVAQRVFAYLLTLTSYLFLTASCESMLEKDSDLVKFADEAHLNNATDTIYSVVGIMKKMQTLADRTIVLGEIRGDLVDITNSASSDVRDVALFNISEGNRFNRPRDYYAVINNCNYFLAYADTALTNNRNQHIFEKEFAAVKAYRAWTYLQLALIYGQVPFITEPLLDMNIDESQFPKYDLLQICDYFIRDLTPYTDTELPGYGAIGTIDSRLTYFPINVLLGELNLWAGHYEEAALSYYRYISTRNGRNSAWPLGTLTLQWPRDDGKYERYTDGWTQSAFRTMAERYSAEGELVTMTPSDSIPSSPNYSSLQSLFNATSLNDGYYSLSPSQALIRLSGNQVYCNYTTTGEVGYAPTNLTDNRSGDLRLSSVYTTRNATGNRPVQQEIVKYQYTTNVHIWRRAMVYLHMAEALNRAGFPEFAFRILSTGINNNVIAELQEIYPERSSWLAQFNFPNTAYVLRTENPQAYTTLGVHSRGCGFTEYNEFYQMPQGPIEEQIQAVEDLIVTEEALELAFEGQRFYDLMRVSLRRNDPSYLASRVYARRLDGSQSEINANLTDPQTWYLPLSTR